MSVTNIEAIIYDEIDASGPNSRNQPAGFGGGDAADRSSEMFTRAGLLGLPEWERWMGTLVPGSCYHFDSSGRLVDAYPQPPLPERLYQPLLLVQSTLLHDYLCPTRHPD